MSEKPFFNSVRMASGQRIPVEKQAKISFQIGPHFFQDSFLILPTMNSVILGIFFSKNIILQSIQIQFVTITRFNKTVESNLA